MASAEDSPEEKFDPYEPYWVKEDEDEDEPSEDDDEPSEDVDEPPECNMFSGHYQDKRWGETRKEVLIRTIQGYNEREARILGSVCGSDTQAKKYNIVRFYGAVVSTEQYQLVVEHCDMYLQDYVLGKSRASHPLEWQEVAGKLSEQIANGMRYLHWKAPYNPIIHRNLNPLSVLIKDPNGGISHITAKIYGFQHAKMLGRHETIGKHTVAPVSGVWLAPEYVLNPEETMESPDQDYMMVDVYSYAMLVWHIFTRQLPYGGKKMLLPQIKAKLRSKNRPIIPKDIPEFWHKLMEKAWHHEIKERPDFIKIYKDIKNHLKSPYPQEDVGEMPKWQLDPRHIPPVHDRIISNKTNQYSVVLEPEKEGKVVLKKPIKENGEVPSVEEFRQFMEFSAGVNHPNILCYDGVFFLESLQMPLMKCSVRQYLEGKTVMRDGKRVKDKCWRSTGNTRPDVVKQVAVGVANGLLYLHSQKNISHDGLSSSNVLLNYQKRGHIEEVKLVDYQLGLLGTSSQSHADSSCMYQAPKGTDPKRADLYSLGVLMVYMYTGEPSTKPTKKWKDREDIFKKGAADMWDKVVNKCLEVTIPLTANRVASTLKSM